MPCDRDYSLSMEKDNRYEYEPIVIKVQPGLYVLTTGNMATRLHHRYHRQYHPARNFSTRL